ncbi:MAG: prenyltransferase/squalene oxidase repeat-containing protein [Gemmataceae bacterium]
MSVIRLHCPVCDKRLKLMAEPSRQGSIVCPRCSHRFGYGAPSSGETVAVATAPPQPARPIVALLVSLLAGVVLLAGLTAGLTLLLQDHAADSPPPAESVTPPVPEESTPIVPTSVPPSPPVRPPDPPWVPREVQTKVHAAMERGVAYLRKQQQSNGSFSGSHAIGLAALPGLALLECGVRRDDPAIQKAAAFLREKGPRLSAEKETYELSLVVLFLDRLGDPADRPLIRDLALRLVAGQRRDGGWGYDCQPLSAEDAPRLAEFLTRTREPHFFRAVDRQNGAKPAERLDPTELRRVRRALPERLRALPVVEATGTDAKPRLPSAGSDNSNTQFATLALWAARRHEAPVERSLELVGRRFRLSQAKNGTWGYQNPGYGTPAMTGVGLLGLAVGHGVSDASPTDQPGRDPDLDRGLAAAGETPR